MFCRPQSVLKRFRHSLVALTALAAVAAPSVASAADVLAEDFEGSFMGSISKAEMKSLFSAQRWIGPAFDAGRAYHSGRVDSETGGNRSMKITFPSNASGSNNSGASASLGFPGSSPTNFATYRKLTLEYDFMFPNGFDWTRGGKMPGLAHGVDASGGNRADGTNGFTARFMWRAGGKMKLYMYVANANYTSNDNPYDIPLAWSLNSNNEVTLQTNRWYRVKQTLEMNSPGNDNGKVDVWLDGSHVIDMNNVRFRQDVAGEGTNWDKVDNLYFSTFRGGGSSDDEYWANTTQYMYYDNIRVYE